MKRIFEYNITQADQGQTILSYLQNKGYSHGVIVHLKKTPFGILKNGSWAYVTERLSCQDHLTITLTEETSSEHIVPVSLPFSIVYEDDDILVVNKPAGMPTHPSQNNYDNTLANAVAYYFDSKNIPYVFRCINRLDRDTSGLTILAKHMLSSAILSKMSAKRNISRTYLAVACGELPPEGTIDAPIARKEGSTIERCVDFEHGAAAITHYKRLAYKDGYSLVSLKLETGRTHQIRVHMKYIGHPLPGDFLYNPDYSRINRQALHAWKLEFQHPITEEKMHFTCEPPEDMQNIISANLI